MKAPRSGLILLNKPEGETSFRCMGPVKRALGHKKLGHTGTLDKFATGLLPLLAGSYTKLNPFFSGLDKRYTGTLRFGELTETLDPEGAVAARGPVPELSDIESVLPQFRGVIDQVPPVYSAVHVHGKRAYQRVRDGEEVELSPRRVEIYALEILDWTPPDLTLAVHCSKGSYIRSLARDLAEACGSVAHLTSLRRDAVGLFDVAESVEPANFDPDRDLHDSAQLVSRLPGIGILQIAEEAIPRLSRGVPPAAEWFPEYTGGEGLYAVTHPSDGGLLAMVEAEQGRWSYRFVIGRSDACA